VESKCDGCGMVEQLERLERIEKKKKVTSCCWYRERNRPPEMVFTGGGNSVCSGIAYTLKIGSEHPDLLTRAACVSYTRSLVQSLFFSPAKALPIRIKYIDITS
jgi:hypothetical protein